VGGVISKLRHRTVSDVMTTRVHFARPLTPFKRLVELIEDNKISAVPIVDQAGVPIGIVSESDLLLKERRRELEREASLLHPRRRRQERAKALGVVASEIMTSPPITVRSDTTLPQAARLMQQRNIRRLVVVDGRGKIVGIVSRSDLLQVFLRTDEELRHEVLSTLIPSLLLAAPEAVQVSVHWNVVSLSGEVDRKSTAEILKRMTRELDGVVEVIDRLCYRWDDSSTTAVPPVSLERSFRAF
jgi:CBS domain-containing protein